MERTCCVDTGIESVLGVVAVIELAPLILFLFLFLFGWATCLRWENKASHHDLAKIFRLTLGTKLLEGRRQGLPACASPFGIWCQGFRRAPATGKQQPPTGATTHCPSATSRG